MKTAIRANLVAATILALAGAVQVLPAHAYDICANPPDAGQVCASVQPPTGPVCFETDPTGQFCVEEGASWHDLYVRIAEVVKQLMP